MTPTEVKTLYCKHCGRTLPPVAPPLGTLLGILLEMALDTLAIWTHRLMCRR